MQKGNKLILIITTLILAVFVSLSFLLYDKSVSVTISANEGSYAQTFAHNNNLEFAAIADSEKSSLTVTDSSKFAYNYAENNTVTIVGYKGVAPVVVIPETIEEMAVTGLDFSPVETGIRYMQIPDSVISINGEFATGRYTAEFFVALVIMLLGYVYAVVVTLMAFKKADTNEKTFYGIPLVYNGLATFVVVTIASALFMILNLPIVAMVVITVVILAFSAMGLVKKNAAREMVEATGEKIKKETAFIRLLTVDAEHLMSSAKTPEIKGSAKKVYEAIRYSDPISNDALADVEAKIQYQFNAFSMAVKNGDTDLANSIATELTDLIDNRNKKCKALK